MIYGSTRRECIYGKSGMVVTKDYEFFQASRLLTDVNEFVFLIVFIQLLDLCAVWAAFHYVYLCHIVLFLIFSNLRKILNIYDRCDKNLYHFGEI